MNDNNLNYNNANNTYRATTNLNTALENVNADNINSATEINVLGPEYSTGVINQTQYYGNGMINQEIGSYSNLASSVMPQQSVSMFESNNIKSNTDNSTSSGLDMFNSGQVNQINETINNDVNFSNNNQFITTPFNNNSSSSNSFLNNGINTQSMAGASAEIYMGEDAVTTRKKVVYEPVIDKKNRPSNSDNTSSIKDSLFVIVITLILIVFVFAMPYIYDFFREAWSAFINR